MQEVEPDYLIKQYSEENIQRHLSEQFVILSDKFWSVPREIMRFLTKPSVGFIEAFAVLRKSPVLPLQRAFYTDHHLINIKCSWA